MGLNTVAVLLNDKVHELQNDGPISRRIAHAMCNSTPAMHEDTYFGVGRVISRSHADHHQIVIVHGNTGCTIYDAKDLPYGALMDMADCLKRHGWTAKQPSKRKG